MKILVAGSPTNGADKLCIKHDVGKLYSILNEKKHIAEWERGQFLLVDSGAHSWNKSTINKVGMHSAKKLPDVKDHMKFYLDFMNQHKNKEVTFVELDVYGNVPKDTVDGWYRDVMSIKGKFNCMRVYHPVLDGGTLSVLKGWIDEGQSYIGLGLETMPMFDKVFALTKDKVKYHGFAMTRVEVIEKYPFFSVDSTTPISTVIFGTRVNKYLKVFGKDEIIRQRSPRIFTEDSPRLEEAIIDVKRTEEYITALWAKRGVLWK